MGSLSADACQVRHVICGRSVHYTARRFPLACLRRCCARDRATLGACVASGAHMWRIKVSDGSSRVSAIGSCVSVGRGWSLVIRRAVHASDIHPRLKRRVWPFAGASLEEPLSHRIAACTTCGRGLQWWRTPLSGRRSLDVHARRSLGACGWNAIASIHVGGTAVLLIAAIVVHWAPPLGTLCAAGHSACRAKRLATPAIVCRLAELPEAPI